MIADFVINIYSKSASLWVMKRIIESLIVKYIDVIAVLGLFALFIIYLFRVYGG